MQQVGFYFIGWSDANIPPQNVIPKARLIAGDLETSFAYNKLNSLKESGVPARASQGLRLAGMTIYGECEAIHFPRTRVRLRGSDGASDHIECAMLYATCLSG